MTDPFTPKTDRTSGISQSDFAPIPISRLVENARERFIGKFGAKYVESGLRLWVDQSVLDPLEAAGRRVTTTRSLPLGFRVHRFLAHYPENYSAASLRMPSHHGQTPGMRL